jgi:hypothetical protein
MNDVGKAKYESPYGGYAVDESVVPCLQCKHYEIGVGPLPAVCDNCLSSSVPYPHYQPLNVGVEVPVEQVEKWAKPVSVKEKQIGGAHYRMMSIQPTEFIVANNLPWREANAIKYICRHKYKNGAEDIRKAIHYLEMLLEDYK